MIRDTLLVIDDSELDLAILNEIFKHRFRVVCEMDARRGMSALKHDKGRICAVLLDICLGRRGAGFMVLHQLQLSRETADLPVILITTDASEKYVRTGMEQGAADFLVKPVDPHTVQERVSAVVRKHWPPKSTVLDRLYIEEEETELPTAASAAVRRSLMVSDLTLDESAALAQRWLAKLERFCRFLPAMDLARCRMLGTLTTCIAGAYVERHPGGPLKPDTAALIGMAAPFCDIGILALPEPEPGQERHAEGDPRHPVLGWELLTTEEDIPLLRLAAEIALWHHRNADGSGWPQDREGEAPLGAMLVHTALRLQHYLHYFRGYENALDRAIQTMRGEVGSVITEPAYEALTVARRSLWEALREGNAAAET